jgi:hypothetical protein
MGTRGHGQEQRHEPRLPSARCDKPIHGLGLPQTAIRRPWTAKFAGMSNCIVDAEFPVDRFRRPITRFALAGFADKALMRARQLGVMRRSGLT